MNLKVGGCYNWHGQKERLVYLGRHRGWFQFALVEFPSVVWCEVQPDQLQHFEETKNETE